MFLTGPTIQLLLNHAIVQIKDLSVTLLNMQGVFLFWNKGATLLDGYESNEIVGNPLNTLHPGIEKEEKLSDYLLTTALKEGRVKHIGRRVRKDGTVYWASVLLNAIFDETGKHIGYIRIAHELRGNEIE
jgi:hypothetical protein